jgi:hypothetical protein
MRGPLANGEHTVKIMDRTTGGTAASPEPVVIDHSSKHVRSDGPTRQTRFENNRWGRSLINIGLIITLAAILTANLPASAVKSRLYPVAQPYLNALGIGEDWGVFAPNPRTEVIYAGAVIKYSDRSESVWNFPVRPGIMAYSDYRWQKYEEHIRLDAYKGLWQPFATYLVKHEAVPGKKAVQVSLARKWAKILPPGAPTSLGPWAQYSYYVAPVGGTK